MARTGSPPRHRAPATARRIRARVPATTAQTAVGGTPSSRRVSAPETDWLWASAGGPTRRGSRSRSVQYVAAPGTATSPTTTVAANATVARAAIRGRPASTSSTTNTSGVSLIPATTPTASPDHRPAGRSRSASTTSMTSRLTCPKARFCQTGSSATAATDSPTATPADVVRPSACRTSTTDPPRAAAEAPVHRVAASQWGRSANGAISTAANGG